jgi:hypothetical protein
VVTKHTNGDGETRRGLAHAFEAFCVIPVISGFLAASGGVGAIIGGHDFLFSLLKVIKSY